MKNLVKQQLWLQLLELYKKDGFSRNKDGSTLVTWCVGMFPVYTGINRAQPKNLQISIKSTYCPVSSCDFVCKTNLDLNGIRKSNKSIIANILTI